MRDLESGRPAPDWWPVGVSMLLAAAAAAVYWNSLSIPFVYDDQTAVVGNQSIRTLATSLMPPSHGAPVSGRPLVNVTLAINYAAGGLDARGYHAFNLLAHVVCAALLFGIVRRTLRSTGVAAIAALVWLAHPLTSEVVDYVSARTESLMASCFLLTLYAHIRAGTARAPAAWNTVSVIACAAGMACKESMVAAPLVVFLYDAIFVDHAPVADSRPPGSRRKAQPRRPARTRWPYYVALSSTWIVLAALVMGSPRAGSAGFAVDPGLAQPVTVWTYLLNQSTMIVRYLQAAAWPHNLVFDYGLPQAIAFGRAAPYFAVCVALLAATVIGLVRWPRVGFLGAWFFLTLAPTSSIVPIATEVGAERRMYLPLMAIAVFAVAALDRFRSWLAASTGRRAADTLALIAVGVTCATLVVLTIRRNAEYRTAQSIWQTVVDRRPHGRARYNLAMALTASGQRADAIAQLREAVRDYPEAHYGLGAELVADGRSDEAIPHFERFIEARPSHIAVVAAWTDLGIAYATRNDMPRAVRAFEQVVAMTPRNPNARRNLANALLETRDFTGAIAQAREALALNANDTVSRDILEMAVAGTRGAAARR